MQKRILLVDDDRELTDLLAEHLRHENFEVSVANSTADFDTLAFSVTPHLIILDIRIGDTDGPETYKSLLVKGLDRRIPVIFLSGLIPENSGLCVSPGRKYAMHSKPFHFTALLRDIRVLLENDAEGSTSS